MTMLLGALGIASISYALGCWTAARIQIAQREARDEDRFWERPSLIVAPEAAE